MRVKRLVTIATVSLLTVALAAGCGSSAQSGGGDVIKVGANLELTGGSAAYGQYAEKGIKMAVDEINEAGGLLGKKLQYVAADNKSEPGESTLAVTRLVTQEKVDVVIGAATSGNTIGSSQIATDNKVPMISPTGTNERVTVENGQLKPWVFRACFIDPFQGEVAANFTLDELKAKNAAVFTDQKSDYAIGLAASFEKNFTAGGGKIVDKENYVGSSDKDFRSTLTKAIAQKPDIIYVPGYYGDVGLLVKQARDAGFTGPILGGDGWSSPVLLEIAGKEALNNTFFTNMMAMDDPQLVDFIKRFSTKYGMEPDTYAAMGYEAVQMYVAAVEKAGSTDREAIRTQLESLKDFSGLTGKVTMDPKTHNPVRSAVIIKFKDGEQVFLTSVAPKN